MPLSIAVSTFLLGMLAARALAMAHAYDARAGRIVEFIRRHAPAGVAGRQGDR